MIKLKLEDVNAWLRSNPRFSEDDHNLKLLAESTDVIDSTEKLTAFINRNPNRFHWLADKPKEEHHTDNRKRDREEEQQKAKAKEDFFQKKKAAKAREALYRIECQKFYSLQGDTIGGRINHSETRKLRREFVQHLLVNFNEFSNETKDAFSDYI